jgi:glycosyltransferase involved in cell wall biosynthesis
MISFVIPALNESRSIEPTINTINLSVKENKITNFEIIIIDDGSTDDLEIKVKDLQLKFNNIVFVKNAKNMGMGYSIKKAINLIKYEKFMILPGGNDIDSNPIAASLKFYHTSDLVMQFPINLEDRTKSRNIVSKIYSLLYVIFFNINVNYINGASLYPTKQVKELKLSSNRHGIISEIITQLFRLDITYSEFPVFYKFPNKARYTITFKNLFDISVSFMKLIFELRIKNRTTVRAKRKNILFKI